MIPAAALPHWHRYQQENWACRIAYLRHPNAWSEVIEDVWDLATPQAFQRVARRHQLEPGVLRALRTELIAS